MANIVKVNTSLPDIRHRADYGPIREEFFGKKMPAHTLVAVAALAQPEFLIEVEAGAGMWSESEGCRGRQRPRSPQPPRGRRARIFCATCRRARSRRSLPG